jgi:hypothetical protein
MIPSIKPKGIGDLKVLKQKLIRYEPGEVAHIENVLATEKRGREHRRLRRTEETVNLEREREEENLRDLQSTERFELQRETQETIKSETAFKAGVEVSGSYGPVEVTAFANFSTSSSKEESDRNSTKFAKDVTERTLSRIVERAREERVVRTLEEFEEKNEHGFDNTHGDENISGVYRWVDKYYRAKVVDYGKRLFYELFVPEPAAFYVFSTRYDLENRVLPVKPAPPVNPGTQVPLTPAHLSRTNYLALLEQYNAAGVEPPPPAAVVIAKALSREFPSDGFWAFANEELKVPKGYQASTGTYRVWYTWEGDPDSKVGVIQIGDNRTQIGIYEGLFFDQEGYLVPISGTGYAIRSFAINIEVICLLQHEYFEKWQVDTYNAMMIAYEKAVLDYEEKVTAAQIQQGTVVGGENPLVNRAIEREELKRCCLTLWSGYAFGEAPGINHVPELPIPLNYPEINQPNAVANTDRIALFEAAFDWANITYELYPYYWGRKKQWVDLQALKSNDPLFERFLQAGAARVLVPVRPAATEAVLYFQLTGVIWNGGPVPPLETTGEPDAALYNSYLEELEGLTEIGDIDRDVAITPDDPDAWLIKVPTSLVWLQSDSRLPSFEEE